MNIITCPQCGTNLTVADELAKESFLSCPFCNQTFKNPLKKSKTLLGCIAAIVLFLILLYAIGYNTDSTPSASSPYYITTDTYAATSKKTFDDIGRYSVNNDTQAIQELIYQGKIVLLTKGTKVHAVKGGFSYHVVRKVGSHQELWVDIGTIKQEK